MKSVWCIPSLLVSGLVQLASGAALDALNAQAKSSACKVCSTTATLYDVRGDITTSLSPELVTITEPVSYVTSGSVTAQSPDLTQTVTVLQTFHESNPAYFFQTRTFTTGIPVMTTKSVCSPTRTPSNYPTPQYCDCKHTPTFTKTLPNTYSTIGTTFVYNSTQTVPPTSYGATTTTYAYYDLFTGTPSIYYVDFTKTVYKATQTTTLPPYQTPSPGFTFQLHAVDNPWINMPSYLQSRSVCSGPPPLCGTRLNFVGASADASGSTSWSIVNGSLFDNSDNAACYFDSAADNGYVLVCNPAGAVGPVKPVDIDCFGNLQTYFNNSNTWAVYNGLPVGIFPQPDPVHHYNESGDSPYVGDLKYVQLQVVPLGS